MDCFSLVGRQCNTVFFFISIFCRIILYIFNTFLLEYSCLTILLVSAVQQSESAIMYNKSLLFCIFIE